MRFSTLPASNNKPTQIAVTLPSRPSVKQYCVVHTCLLYHVFLYPSLATDRDEAETCSTLDNKI